MDAMKAIAKLLPHEQRALRVIQALNNIPGVTLVTAKQVIRNLKSHRTTPGRMLARLGLDKNEIAVIGAYDQSSTDYAGHYFEYPDIGSRDRAYLMLARRYSDLQLICQDDSDVCYLGFTQGYSSEFARLLQTLIEAYLEHQAVT